jgi:hypothetical protein
LIVLLSLPSFHFHEPNTILSFQFSTPIKERRKRRPHGSTRRTVEKHELHTEGTPRHNETHPRCHAIVMPPRRPAPHRDRLYDRRREQPHRRTAPCCSRTPKSSTWHSYASSSSPYRCPVRRLRFPSRNLMDVVDWAVPANPSSLLTIELSRNALYGGLECAF